MLANDQWANLDHLLGDNQLLCDNQSDYAIVSTHENHTSYKTMKNLAMMTTKMMKFTTMKMMKLK